MYCNNSKRSAKLLKFIVQKLYQNQYLEIWRKEYVLSYLTLVSGYLDFISMKTP